MRAAKADAALSKQYRYSLIDANGNDTEKKVMSEAEFIAYALQTGRKPEARFERPCAKCQESYCIDEDSCIKGKTVCSMTDGKYGTVITKTGYDFANYLINAGLTTYEAVQRQIIHENDEKEKADLEAARIKDETTKAAEIEAQAESDYKNWLSEATANYGTSVSENEKLLVQKEIFMHLLGSFKPQAIRLLVLIDNIENPRCRRDIISYLHNGNTTSIKTFEHITGIKLAKTYKERSAQLEVITKADYCELKQYKPRKEAVAAEYNDMFFILQRGDNGPEFVESRGRLWKYGGYDFYIQIHGKGLYKATEGKSGLKITDSCKTLDDLKKKVSGKVAEVGFIAAIEKNIESYGISPLFEQN